MPDAFLRLSAQDRMDALGAAAYASGRPADLLEKDVWVVWSLDALFGSPHGEHMRFKGGTSLSKAYGVIARFSEDIDVTYDIRALLPDLAPPDGEPLPASRSQESRWSREALEALAEDSEMMRRAGLLEEPSPEFAEIIRRCRDLENRVNR